VSIGSDLGHEISSSEAELITSITSGGALIGALMAGIPADRYGRKLGIYIGCVLFFIGSVLQAASFTVAQMTVGRFVVGLGVGSASMIIVRKTRLGLRLEFLFSNICASTSPSTSESSPRPSSAGG
jgi:SP family myo-inositol transporter-like MFS transporter 13